jgi:flagellar biogenesis protein FliO
VAGIILLAAHWIRKNNWATKALGLNDDVIRVVGTHNLGLKRSLMVVDVQGERLVLSVTGNDVRFLTKIGPTEAPDAEGEPNAAPARMRFAQHLAQSRQGDETYRKAAGAQPEIGPEPLDDGNAVNAIRKRIAALKKL